MARKEDREHWNEKAKKMNFKEIRKEMLAYLENRLILEIKKKQRTQPNEYKYTNAGITPISSTATLVVILSNEKPELDKDYGYKPKLKSSEIRKRVVAIIKKFPNFSKNFILKYEGKKLSTYNVQKGVAIHLIEKKLRVDKKLDRITNESSYKNEGKNFLGNRLKEAEKYNKLTMSHKNKNETRKIIETTITSHTNITNSETNESIENNSSNQIYVQKRESNDQYKLKVCIGEGNNRTARIERNAFFFHRTGRGRGSVISELRQITSLTSQNFLFRTIQNISPQNIPVKDFIRCKSFELNENLIHHLKESDTEANFIKITPSNHCPSDPRSITFATNDLRNIYIAFKDATPNYQRDDIRILLNDSPRISIKDIQICTGTRFRTYQPLQTLFENRWSNIKKNRRTIEYLFQIVKFDVNRTQTRSNSENKKTYLKRVKLDLEERGYYMANNTKELYDYLIIGLGHLTGILSQFERNNHPTIRGNDVFDSQYQDEVRIADDATESCLRNLESRIVSPNARTSMTERQADHRISKAALKKAEFKCEFDPNHQTFRTDKRPRYSEAHHLIPMKFQKYYYRKRQTNIHNRKNIVSLCPNCHRAIHLGNQTEKENRLIKLHDMRKISLSRIKLQISYDELLELYE